MNYEVLNYSGEVLHRGKRFFITARPLKLVRINDIPVIGLQLDDDWFIVPTLVDHEERMEDIGPFDTAEQAMVHLALIKDDHHGV